MKAQPMRVTKNGYEPCLPGEATHLQLHLPGPIPYRMLPVTIDSGTRAGTTPNWKWNGSTDMPTLLPSILTRGIRKSGDIVCHSWINDGKVQFLDDCTHELAGKTLDLLDVD